VELYVDVHWPLAGVVPVGVATVLPEPAAEIVTDEPGRTLPKASFTVTVTVTAVDPTTQLVLHAVIDPDVTATVD